MQRHFLHPTSGIRARVLTTSLRWTKSLPNVNPLQTQQRRWRGGSSSMVRGRPSWSSHVENEQSGSGEFDDAEPRGNLQRTNTNSYHSLSFPMLSTTTLIRAMQGHHLLDYTLSPEYFHDIQHYRQQRFFSTTPAATATSNENDGSSTQAALIQAQSSTSITKLESDEDVKESAAEKNRRKRKAVMRKRRQLKLRLARERKKATQKPEVSLALLLHEYDAQSFQGLFDRIAPTCSITKLRQSVKRIRSAIFRKKSRKKSDDDSNKLPLATVLLALLHSTPPNSAAQVSLLEFLLNTEKKKVSKKKTSSQTVASVGVSNDTNVLDDNAVDILLRARERSLQDDDFRWEGRATAPTTTKHKSTHGFQSEEEENEVQTEAEQLVACLRNNLPTKQFHSTLKLFKAYGTGTNNSASISPLSSSSSLSKGDEDISETEITSLDDLVDDADDEKKEEENDNDDNDDDEHDDDNDTTDNDTTDTVLKLQKTSKKRLLSIRKLGTNLKLRTGTHYALVARQVADFFHLSDECVNHKNIVVDSRFAQSQAKWDLYKQEFVTSMLKIQKTILISGSTNEAISVTEESDRDEDDPQTVFLSAVESELDILAQSSVEVAKRDLRFSRVVHFVFEAMVLHEVVDITKSQSSSAAAVAAVKDASLPSQTTAFIDNLPIDITESEVMELYSRCGDIRSIQVFNQRPDLDPGPLTTAQIMDRRKKLLQSVSSGGYKKWQRPRSPVYALLSFKDPVGYQMCTNDSLRIFGMVIHRHPVRSVRSCDMTRLFIEGIPEGMPCLDFEYSLNKQLYPDVFVSLGPGQNNHSLAGSCEIKFPSFELALESFDKLADLFVVKDNPECKVNWMRTRKDAEMWWSREKGFE